MDTFTHGKETTVKISLVDFYQEDHELSNNLQRIIRNEMMQNSKERSKYLSSKLMVIKQIRNSNITFLPNLKPFDFGSDRDVALAVIDKHGAKALKVMNECLRNDRETVLKAVSNDEFASAQFIGSSLRKDRNFIKELVGKNWIMLKDIDFEFRKDEEICRAAINCDPRAIRFVANDYLLNNRELILKIVRQSGLLLEFVGYSLKNNREINLAALNQNPNAYRYVGNVLFKDEEISKFSTKVNSFELPIKSLNGRSLKLYVNPNDTFKTVRWMMAQSWNLEHEFRLIHNSKILQADDDKTLEELEINNSSVLTQIFRLIGG